MVRWPPALISERGAGFEPAASAVERPRSVRDSELPPLEVRAVPEFARDSSAVAGLAAIPRTGCREWSARTAAPPAARPRAPRKAVADDVGSAAGIAAVGADRTF